MFGLQRCDSIQNEAGTIHNGSRLKTVCMNYESVATWKEVGQEFYLPKSKGLDFILSDLCICLLEYKMTTKEFVTHFPQEG